MGAFLLAPCLKVQDFQAALEPGEIDPDIMQWIQSAALQEIVEGLHLQIQNRSAGAVRLSTGIYIPLTDQWTYTGGKTKLSPRQGQYGVLCCITDGGILNMTSDATVLTFTKPPPLKVHTGMSAIYKFAPNEMKYEFQASACKDAEKAAALRSLVPDWSSYLWSCLQWIQVPYNAKTSLQAPKTAQHLIFVNMSSSDRSPPPVKLETTEMSWMLKTCEAVHITCPTNDSKSSLYFGLSSERASYVAYIYGWLPTEEETSRIKECLRIKECSL